LGVVTLHDWQSIRVRCLGRGESIKSVSRDTGYSKNTIKKYLRSGNPPGTTTIARRTSVLTPYLAQITGLLRSDPKLTAARIVAVLRMHNDIPLLISDRAARVYVARLRAQVVPREAFVRQVYAPGDQMQIDFKDVYVAIESLPVKRHLFTARLSYSGALFAKVYRSEDRPSLLDGIVAACVAFGGSTRECVFDNAKTAVTGVHRGRKRDVANSYAEVCGTFGMAMHFAAPSRGNEKGGVEGAHGYVEDNFFRPLRDGSNTRTLNEALCAFTNGRNDQIGTRVNVERAALRALPEHLPATCSRDVAHVNKFAEVTFRTNRYSVPSRFAHRNAFVECFADKIRVIVENEVVAVHERSFLRHDAVLEPLHILDLLRHKHRAVERAEVFSAQHCPVELRDLLRAYVDIDRDTAGKQFVRVVELLEEYPMETVVRAVRMATLRATTDPAAIALLLEQGASAYRIPERLSVPVATIGAIVPAPDLTCYSTPKIKECI
jgi:transposase